MAVPSDLGQQALLWKREEFSVYRRESSGKKK